MNYKNPTYYYPNDEELRKILISNMQLTTLESVEREEISQSSFSLLEKITIANGDSFVFKTVNTYLLDEIKVHMLINDQFINAAKILFFESQLRQRKHFFLMEFIPDLTPFYAEFDISDDMLFDFMHRLARFHTDNTDAPKKYMGQILQLGCKWYQRFITHLSAQVSKVFALQSDESIWLDEIDAKFKELSEQVPQLFQEVVNSPLTIVHGDLNPGNIIVVDSEGGKKLKVIDWGMAHFDTSLIDVGHFLDSIGGIVNQGLQDELLTYYLEETPEIYPYCSDIDTLFLIGKIMHYMFYINFQSLATLQGWVSPNYFLQQLQYELVYLMGLISEKIVKI